MSTIQPSPFQDIRPKRSFSYNDLKKRRLLRSSKSKTKLQSFQNQIISKTQKKTPQTQCKSIITICTNQQNIMQNCIQQVKNTLTQIKKQSSNKSVKKIISKQFYTDRTKAQTFHSKVQLQKKINQKLSFYDKNDFIKQEKQVIKGIIMKKKSQRRLLKYSQIREERKKQKSKSNQKSEEKRLKKDNDTTISLKKDHSEKNNKKYISLNSAKKIRANKFELVPQVNFMTERSTIKQKQLISKQILNKQTKNKEILKDKNRRKLKKSISHIVIKTKIQEKEKDSINFQSINFKQEMCFPSQKFQSYKQGQCQSDTKAQNLYPQQKNMSQQWQPKPSQICIKGQNQDEVQKLIDISGISKIQQKKNLSNFQSCLDIVQQLQQNEKAFFKTNEADQQNCSSISNILNLLSLPTSELKIKLNPNKNCKRKQDLQKFKKVFPKNFFKN